MITGYLIGDQQLIERLRALPSAVNSGLLCAITRLGIELQREVRQDKLGGQVLRSRTGSLRSSIDLSVDNGGGTITATVFSDSRYAGAQEYGFTGTVSVSWPVASISPRSSSAVADSGRARSVTR